LCARRPRPSWRNSRTCRGCLTRIFCRDDSRRRGRR
jgi:hypothetical protein